MNVHFIAIGGSAMHNLAIALKRKGENVTGSDDEIFEPSRSRLERDGILPETIGWDESRITEDLDAIILGMHAREDNPELRRAKELSIPIFSYPEYLYEQSKKKKRIVIGGSHGKTTITSMVLHAMKVCGREVDYMVGAQLEGYDCMVRLTDESEFIVLEGDEYLSSPIDPRPKFHLYRPHVALISGIAWDHMNVFPSFENYVEQFDVFCQSIEPGGKFIYNVGDPVVAGLGEKHSKRLESQPYGKPDYRVLEGGSEVEFQGKKYPLLIFGAHNMQNLMGAMALCQAMGLEEAEFLKAMENFEGAGKRLEKIMDVPALTMFKDFAHSPSKLKATTSAVKEQYRSRKLIACMELHTFSSLSKDFLPLYHGSMEQADVAMVYFNPEVVKHKRLPELNAETIREAFGTEIEVVSSSTAVLEFIHSVYEPGCVLLMMSSGNFDGLLYEKLAESLLKTKNNN
ncbi:MAG: peptidoglycan synthetase [Bacteroidetes bacterium]|nr:MAG: peptidoglycan synthetase [Bacteroidota bacterium]